MDEMLLTGNVGIVTNHFIDHISWNGRIIVCGNHPAVKYNKKNVVTFSMREEDNEYKGLYQAHELDTVIYFSRVLDGQKRIKDEVEQLENALYCSSMSKVKHFVYVTTNDYVGQTGEGSIRTRLLRTCEELCRNYGEQADMDIMLLRVPYLFSAENREGSLYRALGDALRSKELLLYGNKEDKTDFLSDEDLAELLSRIMDEPVKGYYEADIPGGNEMEFEQLYLKVKAVLPGIKPDYRGYREAVPQCLEDERIRELYGWYPMVYLSEALPDMLHRVKEENTGRKKRKSSVLINEEGSHIALIAVEAIALFLVCELLTGFARGTARAAFLDFRLLFVVIMGTVYGTGAGVFSSLLAAAGYFAGGADDANFQILFFNIENWIPFAAYFLVGMIVGHVRDKKREEIYFLKEQLGLLEKKYVFLNEIYGKTLENKEEFSRQIIGYQDSFGKIYQLVRQLDSTDTDNIFHEAVLVLEEMLNVDSVAIYTLNEKSHFARLQVCSRDKNKALAKSLDLEQMKEVWEQLGKDECWYNTDGDRAYPDYASPVFRDGTLTGMIVLWHVKAGQLKLEFANKFNIICGLVQDALVRAIEFSEREEERMMLPGTNIMDRQYFEKAIAGKKQLREEGLSEFVLLRLEAPGMTAKAMGELVAGNIRSEDIIGQREDGNYCLLLSQADGKTVRIIKERLAPEGIMVE